MGSGPVGWYPAAHSGAQALRGKEGDMTEARDRSGAARRLLAGALVAAFLALAAAPAVADTYDPKRAGHPLRIIAYVLHPVGVLMDYLVMRPAHWVGNREPFKTIFGHEDY